MNLKLEQVIRIPHDRMSSYHIWPSISSSSESMFTNKQWLYFNVTATDGPVRHPVAYNTHLYVVDHSGGEFWLMMTDWPNKSARERKNPHNKLLDCAWPSWIHYASSHSSLHWCFLCYRVASVLHTRRTICEKTKRKFAGGLAMCDNTCNVWDFLWYPLYIIWHAVTTSHTNIHINTVCLVCLVLVGIILCYHIQNTVHYCGRIVLFFLEYHYTEAIFLSPFISHHSNDCWHIVSGSPRCLRFIPFDGIPSVDDWEGVGRQQCAEARHC